MATKKTKKNIEAPKKQIVKKKTSSKVPVKKKTSLKVPVKKVSSPKKGNPSIDIVDLELPPRIYLTPLDVAVWLRRQAELQFVRLQHQVITKEIDDIFIKYPHIKKSFLEYETIKGSLYNTKYKYTQLITKLSEKYNIDFATIAINDESGLVTSIKKPISKGVIDVKTTKE